MEAEETEGEPMTDFNCRKCDGRGFFPRAKGMTICDCKAGDKKTRWLELTDAERKAEYRKRTGSGRKKDKVKKTPEGQEEIPF